MIVIVLFIYKVFFRIKYDPNIFFMRCTHRVLKPFTLTSMNTETCTCTNDPSGSKEVSDFKFKITLLVLNVMQYIAQHPQSVFIPDDPVVLEILQLQLSLHFPVPRRNGNCDISN